MPQFASNHSRFGGPVPFFDPAAKLMSSLQGVEGFPLTSIRPVSTARRALALLIATTILTTSAVSVRAQEFATGTVISDTEIEATLQAYARPILQASGMPPDILAINMVVDDSINASATSGNRLFFNTGLILKADNSNEVIGVMAHEIGHVAGGHVVTAGDGSAAPTAISLLSTLLGVAAGIATGSPDLGIALMMGGQRAAIGEYLSFSRGVESRADQFALKALEGSGQSAEGLYTFFNRLAGEEQLITDRADPYVRTHPMSRDRMATIRAHVERSAFKKAGAAPAADTRPAKPGDTIVIASDHEGVELKSVIADELTRMGFKVKDLGTATNISVDEVVAKAVDTQQGKAGVAISGGGSASSKTASSHPGVRAVLANDEAAARAGREQNNANVLSVGARVMDPEQARRLMKAFLDTPFQDNNPVPDLEERHQRMVAKLYAFLKPQFATLQRYPESNVSVPARYARTVAYYRRGQFDKSIPLVDGLLKDRPKDPFFWQIKGDMQLSRSKPDEAIIAYREALKYMPNASEILNAKAHAMIESANPTYAAEAQETLKRSAALDPENAYTWDLMARGYALYGDQGMSAYAAAEKAMLIGQFGDVARYTMQADKLLEKGTPTWYRLQDIKITAQNHMREMKERRR
jgi:RpiB/LacA/LacB family sugar-phosphate isomerase